MAGRPKSRWDNLTELFGMHPRKVVIELFDARCTITEICEKVGIDRRTVLRWTRKKRQITGAQIPLKWRSPCGLSVREYIKKHCKLDPPMIPSTALRRLHIGWDFHDACTLPPQPLTKINGRFAVYHRSVTNDS